MTAEYFAVGFMFIGGTLKYWGIRTPPASTNCLTGGTVDARLESGVDGGGIVRATTVVCGSTVGATTVVCGSTVGAGLGVSNMQAARPMAAKKDVMRNFSFIVERIT
jgi:hypothetical protein